jgi:hypothetical protein
VLIYNLVLVELPSVLRYIDPWGAVNAGAPVPLYTLTAPKLIGPGVVIPVVPSTIEVIITPPI